VSRKSSFRSISLGTSVFPLLLLNDSPFLPSTIHHILSTLQKFPPPRVLRSDSRSARTSSSFLGFIIPDRIELNFFFFRFLTVFLTFAASVLTLDFRFRARATSFTAGWFVEARGLFLVVVEIFTEGNVLEMVTVVVGASAAAAVGSCGETGVFGAVFGLQMEGVLVVVASEGIGGALEGGAASAESILVVFFDSFYYLVFRNNIIWYNAAEVFGGRANVVTQGFRLLSRQRIWS